MASDPSSRTLRALAGAWDVGVLVTFGEAPALPALNGAPLPPDEAAALLQAPIDIFFEDAAEEIAEPAAFRTATFDVNSALSGVHAVFLGFGEVETEESPRDFGIARPGPLLESGAARSTLNETGFFAPPQASRAESSTPAAREAPAVDTGDAASANDGAVFEAVSAAVLDIQAAAIKPVATIAELADYLINGFWEYAGEIAHHWAITTITYNLGNLDSDEIFLAQSALNAWHEVANLDFVLVSSGANINFNHNGPGLVAYETDTFDGSGHTITATIDISRRWIDIDGGARDGKTGIDSYGYQTYVHEIGHALGLGHQGPYNGSASYSTGALYANDTWQYSVMSYFAQNNYDGSSYRYVITPQMADIYAAQLIYGAASTRTGDTTYGFNNTAGAVYDFSLYTPVTAYTIYDSGGADTFDVSGYSQAQTIDLRAGAFSSIGGLVHNIGIATNTLIENAVGGGGSDIFYANGASDSLKGGGGNDTFYTGAGNDTIDGGANQDKVVYTGNRADYTVTFGGGVFTVKDNRPGHDGTDTVSNVEFLQFLNETDPICFMRGTRVRAPGGEVPVETLRRGDRVLTADGRVMPVTWLGRQTISTRFADPLRVLPIRIKAGALGPHVPARDLLLSPDHALLVGGVLIQAGALVNGTTVRRETNVPEVFTYYHVELDDHALILAESTPAETFVDNVDRLRFDNWDEHLALYPHGKPIVELPYPRAKGRRQVPRALRAWLEALAASAEETARYGLAG